MSISAPVVAPTDVWHWPRQWSQQEPLLEAQHDRLEAQLNELLQLHARPLSPGSRVTAEALDPACRRLLWELRLHLRLEERWLGRMGCLCAGHRQAHIDAGAAALRGYHRSCGDARARLHWLQELRSWFIGHRSGPDRNAYALASSLSRELPRPLPPRLLPTCVRTC